MEKKRIDNYLLVELLVVLPLVSSPDGSQLVGGSRADDLDQSMLVGPQSLNGNSSLICTSSKSFH